MTLVRRSVLISVALSLTSLAHAQEDLAEPTPSVDTVPEAPASPVAPAPEAGAPAAAPAKAQAPSAAPSELAGPEKVQERPFRMGYIRINDYLDRTKPLAALDGAGWTMNTDLLIGGFDERWVGALSLSNKKVAWWFDGKVGMTAPPGSFGSSVVLGFRDGKVVKLDALTGKRLWTANLDSFSERPMLLSGTTLYVLTAAQVLYALDFQSGKTLWLFDGGFPEGLTIRGGARPIVHDNKVIFGLASGELLAVNVDSGKLVWRYNPAYNDARFHGVVGEMVVRNNKLLIARYDGLVASVDLASNVRSTVWQDQLPGLTTSAFRNGRYYVGGVNGDVYGYDADTGRRIWRSVTDAAITSITPGETLLFIAGGRGRVSAMDQSSGHIVWHDQPGGTLASAPILQDNAIYFTTGLRSIYGYKIR